MVRILFEMFRYRKEVDGDMIGPDGADGFRNIRYIFENDISGVEFMLIIYALLAVTADRFHAAGTLAARSDLPHDRRR